MNCQTCNRALSQTESESGFDCVDCLRKENEKLQNTQRDLIIALENILSAQPCMENGSCFYPMHDGEGEYIGEQPVDPIMVIQNMSIMASDALHKAREPKP